MPTRSASSVSCQPDAAPTVYIRVGTPSSSYVTNRDAGTVSVVDFASRSVVATWTIPGGSPDMGGVSADGRVLWLSGRYDAEVYAISTTTGNVIARIAVGDGPHGLCVWPQPGRCSSGIRASCAEHSLFAGRSACPIRA